MDATPGWDVCLHYSFRVLWHPEGTACRQMQNQSDFAGTRGTPSSPRLWTRTQLTALHLEIVFLP